MSLQPKPGSTNAGRTGQRRGSDSIFNFNFNPSDQGNAVKSSPKLDFNDLLNFTGNFEFDFYASPLGNIIKEIVNRIGTSGTVDVHITKPMHEFREFGAHICLIGKLRILYVPGLQRDDSHLCRYMENITDQMRLKRQGTPMTNFAMDPWRPGESNSQGINHLVVYDDDIMLAHGALIYFIVKQAFYDKPEILNLFGIRNVPYTEWLNVNTHGLQIVTTEDQNLSRDHFVSMCEQFRSESHPSALQNPGTKFAAIIVRNHPNQNSGAYPGGSGVWNMGIPSGAYNIDSGWGGSSSYPTGGRGEECIIAVVRYLTTKANTEDQGIIITITEVIERANWLIADFMDAFITHFYTVYRAKAVKFNLELSATSNYMRQYMMTYLDFDTEIHQNGIFEYNAIYSYLNRMDIPRKRISPDAITISRFKGMFPGFKGDLPAKLLDTNDLERFEVCKTAAGLVKVATTGAIRLMFKQDAPRQIVDGHNIRIQAVLRGKTVEEYFDLLRQEQIRNYGMPQQQSQFFTQQPQQSQTGQPYAWNTPNPADNRGYPQGGVAPSSNPQFSRIYVPPQQQSQPFAPQQTQPFTSQRYQPFGTRL
jgi:hypothetical protein